MRMRFRMIKNHLYFLGRREGKSLPYLKITVNQNLSSQKKVQRILQNLIKSKMNKNPLHR